MKGLVKKSAKSLKKLFTAVFTSLLLPTNCSEFVLSTAAGADSSARFFWLLIMICCVYVLLNPEDKIYIGQTQDLSKRLSEHNDPACHNTHHTKRYHGPWKLIHSESFSTRSEAMKREKALKSSRGRNWIREVLIPSLKAGG